MQDHQDEQDQQDHRIKGPFVAIPEKTMDSKAWKKMSGNTRAVYQTMLRKYKRTGKGANGQVTWSQPELADESGLSLRTVKRSIKELKSKKWIEVVSIGCRWARGTTYYMKPKYADGGT